MVAINDVRAIFLTNHYLAGVGGGAYATSAYANAVSEIYGGQLLLIYPQKVEGDMPSFVDPAVPKIGCVDRRVKLNKLYGYARGHLTRFTERFLDECLKKTPNARVVFLDGSLIGGAFAGYFKKRGFHVVTLHHNVESEYHVDSKTPVSLWGKVPFWINRSEQRAVEMSDLNLTITDDDANAFRRLYPKCARVETLGVFEYSETESGTFGRVDAMDEIVCAITGSMASHQTHDGVKYFLESLFPAVESKFPNVKYLIAGRSPRQELYDISNGMRNVEIIPSPKDMNEIMARANLYLCPTRLGGGLKLRVMDGLRAGLPILVHVVSARGYENMAEKGYLYSFETIDQFVEGYAEIVDGIARNKYSNSEIRKAYVREFSFRRGVQRFSECLKGAGIR